MEFPRTNSIKLDEEKLSLSVFFVLNKELLRWTDLCFFFGTHLI